MHSFYVVALLQVFVQIFQLDISALFHIGNANGILPALEVKGSMVRPGLEANVASKFSLVFKYFSRFRNACFTPTDLFNF